MNKDSIITPFTKEQVENLNKFQNEGRFHPFTCCSSGDSKKCERRNETGEGILIASEKGWVCPCGEYTQNWAHDFMGKPMSPRTF